MSESSSKKTRISDGSYCGSDCPQLVTTQDPIPGQAYAKCLFTDPPTKLKAYNVGSDFNALKTHPTGIAVIRNFACRQASSRNGIPVQDQMKPKYYGDSNQYCGSTVSDMCPYVERAGEDTWLCIKYDALLQRNLVDLRRARACLKTEGKVAPATAIVADLSDVALQERMAIVDKLERQGLAVPTKMKAEAAGFSMEILRDQTRDAITSAFDSSRYVKPGVYQTTISAPGSRTPEKKKTEVPEYTVAPLRIDFDDEEE